MFVLPTCVSVFVPCSFRKHVRTCTSSVPNSAHQFASGFVCVFVCVLLAVGAGGAGGMARYQGGKNRNGLLIASAIQATVEVLQRKADFPVDFEYLEPFVGMAGVLRHVVGMWPERHLVVSDRNVAVVRLWQTLLRTGSVDFLPKRVSERLFNNLKVGAFQDDEHAPLRGLVGHALSFGGAYFSGYARRYDKRRDYWRAGITSLQAALNYLTRAARLDVVDAMSYMEFSEHLEGCVIYCDPPYKRNQECSRNPLFRDFDHAEFWARAQRWSEKNIVFVSEERAPSGWVSVQSSVVCRSHNHHGDSHVRYIRDRLYVHKTWSEFLKDQ